jgi:hypothetical protein
LRLDRRTTKMKMVPNLLYSVVFEDFILSQISGLIRAGSASRIRMVRYSVIRSWGYSDLKVGLNVSLMPKAGFYNTSSNLGVVFGPLEYTWLPGVNFNP